jgi:hypothetical protein
MQRIVSFVFLITIQLLFGRENPFVPVEDYKGVDAPTNVVKERENFEQQSILLPSNARVLKYVVFGYQTLSGDIEQMRIEVDKDIDWHDPLVVSKKSLFLSPSLAAPPVLDEKSAPKTTKSETKIPKPEPAAPKKADSVTVGYEELIGFQAFSNRLLITTNDELLRHFLVADPYKIVVDFKKDTAFYTQNLPIEFGAFKKITLGSHNDYYRAAILLDGHYAYDIKKIDTGFEIILK